MKRKSVDPLDCMWIHKISFKVTLKYAEVDQLIISIPGCLKYSELENKSQYSLHNKYINHFISSGKEYVTYKIPTAINPR